MLSHEQGQCFITRGTFMIAVDAALKGTLEQNFEKNRQYAKDNPNKVRSFGEASMKVYHEAIALVQNKETRDAFVHAYIVAMGVMNEARYADYQKTPHNIVKVTQKTGEYNLFCTAYAIQSAKDFVYGTCNEPIRFKPPSIRTFFKNQMSLLKIRSNCARAKLLKRQQKIASFFQSSEDPLGLNHSINYIPQPFKGAKGAQL